MKKGLDAILTELKALRKAVEGQQGLMTLEETADFLGIGMNTMYALKDRPDFPVKQLGPRVYKIPKMALLRWMNTGRAI